mgnify:FL=1
MFELTINDKVYPFRFGMGSLREINKRVEMTFDEDTGAKRNIGLYYTIIDLMDGVLETLEDVLLAANQGEQPRLQRTALDAYLEDENTDVDQLFADVLDFFERANCTKSTLTKVREFVEKRQAEQAEQAAQN